jgi:hypothetical protein
MAKRKRRSAAGTRSGTAPSLERKRHATRVTAIVSVLIVSGVVLAGLVTPGVTL